MAHRRRAALFRLGFLPKLVETRLEEWIEESDCVNIFVAGQTGTGKSTLVNGLVGREVSHEGKTLDPGTKRVCEYLCKVDDILVSVWDSPGLQDGYGREDEYLRDIIRRWKKIDLFVYCIRMQIRFEGGDDNRDIATMCRLNGSLGVNIWKNALIILTFANDIIDMKEEDGLTGTDLEEYFEKKVNEWKEMLHTVLHEEVGIPKEIADSIEVVPAGYYKCLELLPNGECWMSRLWLKALAVCSSRAQPAFIQINEHRFKTLNEIGMKESQHRVQEDFLHDRPLIIASKGEEIGAALGCPGKLAYMTGLRSGVKSNAEFALNQLLVLYLAQKNKFIDQFGNLLSPPKDAPRSKSAALKVSYGSISICAFCGKHTGKLQKCGLCRKVMYCNRECQRKDWKKHKEVCDAEQSELKKCDGCEKEFYTLQSCPCRKVAYCSKECQRMDWHRHKTDCMAVGIKKI